MEYTTQHNNTSKIGAFAVFCLLLIGGVYKIGYEAGKIETAESMQKQVEYWKEQSGKVTEKIVIEYVDRVEEIVKWRTKNVEVIKLVPSGCELSDGWVSVHDSSAEGRDADPTRAADDTPSGIKDTEALGTIVENYASCHENREQVIALQSWIREQQQLVKDQKSINTNTAQAGSQQQEEQP